MNSIAVVVMAVALMAYAWACIQKKLELMDTVCAAFAAFLVLFAGVCGILRLSGGFSLNKTLAAVLAVSFAAAPVCRIMGNAPSFLLKKSQGLKKPLIRDFIIFIIFTAVYALVSVCTDKEDSVAAAAENFNNYLWLVFAAVLLAAAAADIVVHLSGYTRARDLLKKYIPFIAAAVVLFFAVFFLFSGYVNGGLTGLVFAALLLAAFLCAGIGLSMLYRSRDFAELLFLAASETIMAYLFVSGVLIGFNRFSLMAAVCGTLVLLLAAGAVIYAVFKTKPEVSFNPGKNIAGLAFCAVLVPLSFSVFGMFGMGQDEGVYQAKAIGYLYGYNDNYMSFEEYDKCAAESDKSAYTEALWDGLAGYNFALDEENTQNSEAVSNDTLGSLHGVHTFSALLAAYARVFGLDHMMQLGTWILMLSVFLLWLTLENLGVCGIYRKISVFLYIISPQILWQAKTSLVETTLAFLVLALLYIVTDKRHEALRWLFWLPVTVFSLFHITIYVFMPVFVLMAYGLYFSSGKRRYLASAGLCTAGYLCGFYMMCASSLTYVYGNYDRLYIGPVGPGNLKLFVTAVCIAVFAVTALFALIPFGKTGKAAMEETRISRKNSKIPQSTAGSKTKRTKKIKRTKSRKPAEILWGVFIRAAFLAGLSACVYAAYKSSWPFSYMTGYAYLISSGVIFIPAVFFAAFFRPSWLKKDSSIVLLCGMFYYCIILYSAVFKKEVLYYYYYGRYTVPYIAVIVLLGAYVLQRCFENIRRSRKMQEFFKLACFLAAGCVAAVMLPYSAVVASQQDQTEMQWDILDEIAQTVQTHENITADTADMPTSGTDGKTSGSAVFISRELLPQLMLPLKFMTQADIYPLQESFQEQYERISAQYSHIYLVCTDKTYGTEEYTDTVYHKDNKMQTDVKMPEKLSGLHAFIPYAEEFVSSVQPVTVYEYLLKP